MGWAIDRSLRLSQGTVKVTGHRVNFCLRRVRARRDFTVTFHGHDQGYARLTCGLF
jgi:hypothetical protein